MDTFTNDKKSSLFAILDNYVYLQIVGENMAGIVIELELSPQQYAQLTAVAQTRQLAITEAAHLAITDWLERDVRLVRARTLMRQLGQGLGEGHLPHNVARTHDAHLYSRRAL